MNFDDKQVAQRLADLDEKLQLMYEHELMHRILLVIANCSENSTLDGVQLLAGETVVQLGKPMLKRTCTNVVPVPAKDTM